MNGPQLLMAQGCSLPPMTGPPAVEVRGIPLIHDKTVDEWGTRDSGG